MNWFVGGMNEIARFVSSKIENIIPMIVSPNTIGASTCLICEKPFTKKDVIVHDHCHLTGQFGGFAHQAPCNLTFKKQFLVPITFHNLSDYDSYFIIRDISKRGCASVLPINREKYISFTSSDDKTDIKFRFIDSFRFLGAGLDTLVSNLEVKKLEILKKEFGYLEGDKFMLLIKKGVFPYDYIENLDRLEETELPTKKNFHNKLNDTNISDHDYTHAENVWRKFDIKTLGEYSDLYMKTNILLLADVFENFRELSTQTYSLDPSWYFTLPGYTRDCMLKIPVANYAS
ncbi:uncharacterized protein [Leptinotarsa decemlineata]|uniref:uncharacterized protein n=1 Tax=Leptinotarsa decemlineata TaxID=7539 RepID=UPI003D306557